MAAVGMPPSLAHPTRCSVALAFHRKICRSRIATFTERELNPIRCWAVPARPLRERRLPTRIARIVRHHRRKKLRTIRRTARLRRRRADRIARTRAARQRLWLVLCRSMTATCRLVPAHRLRPLAAFLRRFPASRRPCVRRKTRRSQAGRRSSRSVRSYGNTERSSRQRTRKEISTHSERMCRCRAECRVRCDDTRAWDRLPPPPQSKCSIK